MSRYGDYAAGTSFSARPAVGDYPGNAKQRLAIGTLPLAAQEACIMEDLLFVMVGISGKYIFIQEGPDGSISFGVDDTLDPSLSELVHRLLPVCRSFMTLDHYVTHCGAPEMGMVHHALCAAVRDVLKEYLILVAQLEHQLRNGGLSLHRMWFYVQEGMGTLSRLESVVATVTVGKLRGAQVLSLLHERATTAVSDSSGRSLWRHMATMAAAPLLHSLEQWIYCGKIVDPYGEFFVVEAPHRDKEGLRENFNDAYWEKKYTIAEDRVPTFLTPLVGKALDAGKYLRVVQECGKDSLLPVAKKIEYSPSTRDYVAYVEDAYTQASQMLLDLLMKEKGLLSHLRSLKLYFLHGRSDIFQGFLDIADHELSKPKPSVDVSRLESLLELAVRISSAHSDPNKDCLRVELAASSLAATMSGIHSVGPAPTRPKRGGISMHEEMVSGIDPASLAGYDALSLEYDVGWPVSLVANRKALTSYSMLFRHLLHCKRVERALSATWHPATVPSRNPPAEARGALGLRHRMLHFVQNLLYYCSSEVNEQNWTYLEQKLVEAATVDQVIKAHDDFQKTCLKQCMLSSYDLFQAVYKLTGMCENLAAMMLSINQSLAKGVSIGTTNAQHVNRLDKEFTEAMQELLKRMKYYAASEAEHRMSSLVLRLNYNNFYTKSEEETA